MSLSARVAHERVPRQHLVAAGQALLVTFLWSTSWVLIKIGFDEHALRPLGFAGLRYALAAAILLPFGVRALRAPARALDGGLAVPVALYGVLFITVTQGAQFAALAVLPATTVNLILAAIPAVVALVAVARSEETPSRAQAAGIGLLGLGAAAYFGPLDVAADAWPGVAAALVCVAAAAASSHLGRSIARDATDRLGGPLGLTALSMGIGAAVLLAVALVVEGLPALGPTGWAIVVWLGLVNTAVAFTIWNHTLRVLTAVESSVVNNTMVVQIAVLAVVFLGERLSAGQVVGLAAAGTGALVVQLAPRLRRCAAPPPADEQLGEPMR
jgi:drug/metabolite transporter (DMT)-like permease